MNCNCPCHNVLDVLGNTLTPVKLPALTSALRKPATADGRRRRRRRAVLVGAMSVLLVASAAFAIVRTREECGEAVRTVPAAESRTPFLDAEQQAEQPDEDRDTLVRTLKAGAADDPTAVGEVVGAVGYHYEQWAQLSSYAQGIGVRTRDNPDFTMLDDETLRPRWSVAVGTKRSTYDASAERYLVATMPEKTAPDLVSLDADDGREVWCASLGGGVVSGEDPFATQVLEDEDVAVLGPGTGDRERVVRLSGSDGAVEWERTLDADSGDFLGDLGEGTVLAGGRAQFELLDAASVAERPAGNALVLLDARDGSTIWEREEPAGSDVHVLGTDPDSGLAVVLAWSGPGGDPELRAITRDGDEAWSVVPAKGTYFDATVRAGRVLVRAGNRWSAYGLADGQRLWTRTVPGTPQFLPYGFELASVPLLDGDHVLVGGTTALHTLDLSSGEMTSTALPTDGINTTFWPYQVTVSERLVGIATNTGAVLVRRVGRQAS